jgi:hypothetical protein
MRPKKGKGKERKCPSLKGEKKLSTLEESK